MYYPYGKRLLDVTLSLLSLLLLWPLFILIGLLVRYKLGAPILFHQQRPGLSGKPFVLLKFRSMADEYDESGNLLSDSERLTRFGRLLRSTSLDELPELVNILRGEMSLVGPRPLLMDYLDRYTPEQARRHTVKPGLTGWVQVNGRNALSWEEKFALDIWYVDNLSFLLDLKILYLTVSQVVKREGISHEGQATMIKFVGQGRASEGSSSKDGKL